RAKLLQTKHLADEAARRRHVDAAVLPPHRGVSESSPAFGLRAGKEEHRDLCRNPASRHSFSLRSVSTDPHSSGFCLLHRIPCFRVLSRLVVLLDGAQSPCIPYHSRQSLVLGIGRRSRWFRLAQESFIQIDQR